MNAEKIDKKYTITEQLSSSDVYYSGYGYAFHEGNRLYLTNIDDEYGYKFYIIPSEKFMKEFDELDEIPKIEFLKNMWNKSDRDYYKVNKIVFSPALRYTEIDYTPVNIYHEPYHYIKSREMGCGYLFKSDRYVDGLYWDDETMEYVDDDGVPYNFEIVE